MEENNYFLSWQLPSMSLSWRCIIPVGCSVVNLGRSERRMVLIDVKKEPLDDEGSLNERFWE